LSNGKIVSIDAMNGTDGAKLNISQFTENFDTVRFLIDNGLTEYTIVIVAEINGVPVLFETDGEHLYTEFAESSGQTFLVWHPGKEVTCADGLVVYQIAAYKTENDKIVSTWYSKEGRITVTDSIDTSPYSTSLIGSHPDLITRLILETDKLRRVISDIEKNKIDKAEGKDLSQNDFTDELLEKLAGIEEGAEVNAIAKIMIDGKELEIKKDERAVDLELDERFDGKVDKVDYMGLSTNDYTDHDAMKLADIEYEAQKNVQADWSETDYESDAFIRNKPTPDEEYDENSTNAQSGLAVAQAISLLVGSAPDTLNTLEALAKALGNDSGFADMVMSEISKKADKSNHSSGFEGGLDATTESGGGAVGEFAESYGGGAVGNSARVMRGGAIGYKAVTGDGFAGGYYAQTVTNDEGIAIDAIQLGTGQNDQPKTLQVYDYTLMNSDGTIPAERMAVRPVGELDGTMVSNKAYNLAGAPSKVEFPSVANDGDVIYLTFVVGNTVPNISFITTNTTDYELTPEANTGYEIFGKYNANIGKWIVNYSQYTVTDG